MGAIWGPVLGVVGAGIGLFFGNPYAGFMIGASVGGTIDVLTAPDVKPPGSPAPELQLTQNEIGALIPDLLGTSKLGGNLLFYGNEYAIKRGSGSTKRYWYTMTWGLGFFMGEGTTLYTIFLDEKVLWSGTLNKPVSGGKQSITGLSGFTTSGYHTGSIDVYFGTSDQVADASIGTMNGDATLNSPYRGLFYMVFKNCIIGVNSKRQPNISIVVRKSPVYAFSDKETVGIYDYNPMHAIWHIMATLTGLPSTWLDTTDFSAVADVIDTEGLGISMLLGTQQSALDYISTILLHIKGILRFQSDGTFHPKLIRNDYDAGTLQLLDENDLIEPPVFKRKHWIDTLNEIKVQYSLLDRNAAVIDLRQSTADPVAVDMGNYNVQGRTVSKTIQYALFTTNKNANWAGREDLRAGSYPLAVLQFKVNRNMFQLLPGDCFKFSYAPNGISTMVCRTLNISEEEFESEDITIEAVEDFFAVASAITEYTDPTAPSVVLPDYTIIYFTYQKVMEAPYDMVVAPAIIEVLPIACPTSSLDKGLEFDISLDGGASYTMIDDMDNLVPCGTLVAEYPSTTLTIDNVDGFTIDFEYGAFQIMSCAFSQALSGSVNVALLGNEIIFFQTITLVSGTQYKIDVVFRARMDTAKQTHAIGTVFYFLGVNSENVTTSGLIAGVSRDFKLIPYNDLFYGTVAGATNINLALTGRAQTPYPPVNLTANSEGILPTYTADIVLAWSPRKRGYGAGTGIPGTILPDGTWEGLFEVEIWVSGTLKRTTSAIDAITYTYTSTMNTTDNGSLATSVLCKVLNYRTVDSVVYSSIQAEITCVKI